MDTGTTVKPVVMQAAMRMHFSQSTGDGAFDGQHGMSFAISSVVADTATSYDIPAIAPSGGDSAMTGRDNGANTKPAIMKIATSWRMAIWWLMVSKSHTRAEIESLTGNDTVMSKNRGMASLECKGMARTMLCLAVA